ncbi:hypothetical protein LR48_Vigan106s000400 [Vigna angularis]|uniref:Uncharacterized protein n=1 Tax=Phaseolus angularis TaxID=3914 RepID=A0A0L9T4F0_PHAAN|nr:hypothetical protein LR48_Vigan106s000400 [Vigna angularis]
MDAINEHQHRTTTIISLLSRWRINKLPLPPPQFRISTTIAQPFFFLAKPRHCHATVHHADPCCREVIAHSSSFMRNRRTYPRRDTTIKHAPAIARLHRPPRTSHRATSSSATVKAAATGAKGEALSQSETLIW